MAHACHFPFSVARSQLLSRRGGATIAQGLETLFARQTFFFFPLFRRLQIKSTLLDLAEESVFLQLALQIL